jgi:hypothetical protein
MNQWFRDMSRDPDNYAVAVLALDDNGEEVPLNLDTRVSDYDSIIRTKEEKDAETGSTAKYNLIELLTKRMVPSGK